ncbi:MAG: hypothetical protein WBX15_03035 [Thermoanaerobaculia bacterium]
MQSNIARRVRTMRVEEDLRFSPAERFARALELGERQLEILMAAQRIDRTEALRRIEASRDRRRNR